MSRVGRLSTRAASSTSVAGRYPITVGLGSLAADNYDFTPVNGQVVVHPKVVDVSSAVWFEVHLADRPEPRPAVLDINAIDVIFSDDVAVSLGQLSLTGVNVPSYGLGGFRYDPTTKDAAWTLPSALDVDRLMMALDGAAFADDPTIGVGHFGLNFDVLPGDFNGDGMVTGRTWSGSASRSSAPATRA